MADDNRSCGTCTYFEVNAAATDEGECRRYAPQPGADRRETMWVTVAVGDWCGEYSSS